MFRAVPKHLRFLILSAGSMAFAITALAGDITISSPKSGQTVSTSFQLKASASGSTSISYINVYINGAKVTFDPGAQIDKTISTSAGSNKRLTLQAVTSGGGTITKTIYINVSGSSSGGGTTTPSGAKVVANIDQMGGWESCTVCAGTGGKGSTASYSLQQNISSPSMDGKSIKFNLGGSTPFSNALWWKQLGADSTKRHFTYDVYFYLKNPNAAQSLEFDVNQSLGGKKYIFGTQCSMNRGTFDIYSAASHWIHTSISCTAAKTAYKWHHLVWEFERTTGNNVKFVSVTLNGAKHYINKTYAPKASGAKEINVAFQMDGNRSQTNYTTWLDKVTLTYW